MTEKEFIDQAKGEHTTVILVQEGHDLKMLWRNVGNPYYVHGMLAQAQKTLESFIRDQEVTATAQKLKTEHEVAQVAQQIRGNLQL